MSHLSQKQHLISQVYLRQFGYKRENQWYISVWEKSKNSTDEFRIVDFNTEINIFDLPIGNLEERRHFESKSKFLEDNYSIIIKSLIHQKRLLPKHKDLLCHFLANMYCRPMPNRELIQSRLKNKNFKDAFLSEITMFNENNLKEWKEFTELTPLNIQLNFIIGQIMDYLICVLRNFTFVILKDYDNRGWFTSDNPVIIKINENENHNEYPYLIPLDCELYFPLSSQFCLFGFHKSSTHIKNELKNLKENLIHNVTEQIHDMICKLSIQNDSQYFIFNQEIPQTFLDS
ncbi:MAG: hypothetical protein C0459_11710 [Chitinophaga sp.]|jgi:hypothetical protein|nr:hypothetical protein [Chitinophaga sp.]